jgi:hypothetical protein
MPQQDPQEYTGELPPNVKAQLEEHSAGGFILFRIGPNGNVIEDLCFDSEIHYLALAKKALSILLALNTIDNALAVRSLSTPSDFGDFDLSDIEDDDDEDDDGEEEFEES